MGAPTAKLETIVITSPFKVLALFFNILSMLCLIIATPSTFWFYSDQTVRYGLWQECIVTHDSDKKNLLDDKAVQNTSCSLNNKVWVQLCGSFIVVSFCCTIIGLVLIIMGLKHKKRQERKMKFYGAAAFVFFVGVICILTTLIMFPLMFIKELHERGRDKWYFGWSYGVAWGAVFFLADAVILLLCDRKKEELFYKESLYLNNDEEDIIDRQEAKIKTLKR
ncbi:unnamed protein product [Brachionus calyciflorus]|uniref:Transmembrane protein 47 n=1 Tax=Brachionus calyciflorus TaxID=104777 RepID=A0A813M2Z8_9BILA|nr:unnamed protein product [Brachionus calyciflorus]